MARGRAEFALPPPFASFPEGSDWRMDIHFAALPTIAKLRLHIHQKLCAYDRLDPRQTPLHQARIIRGGKPCGLFFQIEGPRLLKTYAVWAGDENRILFYNSTGLRFAETRLSKAPDPELDCPKHQTGVAAAEAE